MAAKSPSADRTANDHFTGSSNHYWALVDCQDPQTYQYHLASTEHQCSRWRVLPGLSAQRFKFEPHDSDRRFLVAVVQWAPSMNRVLGEWGGDEEEKRADFEWWENAMHHYPLAKHPLDVPPHSSGRDELWHNEADFIDRSTAIAETAGLNRSEWEQWNASGRQHELDWHVVVEVGKVTPRSLGVVESHSSAIGKLTLTIEYPLRVIIPTLKERELFKPLS